MAGCPWCGKWMTAYILISLLAVILFFTTYILHASSVEEYEMLVERCNRQAAGCDKIIAAYNTLAYQCGDVPLSFNLPYLNVSEGVDD